MCQGEVQKNHGGKIWANGTYREEQHSQVANSPTGKLAHFSLNKSRASKITTKLNQLGSMYRDVIVKLTELDGQPGSYSEIAYIQSQCTQTHNQVYALRRTKPGALSSGKECLSPLFLYLGDFAFGEIAENAEMIPIV